MRIRKMDASGDMSFGAGQGNFFQNSPDGVGQLVETRMALWLGQWFLFLSDGTPWLTKVLGKYTGSTRDAAIQARILATPGVNAILSYASQLNRDTRVWNVQVTLDTIYGQISFDTAPLSILPTPFPPTPIPAPPVTSSFWGGFWRGF